MGAYDGDDEGVVWTADIGPLTLWTLVLHSSRLFPTVSIDFLLKHPRVLSTADSESQVAASKPDTTQKACCRSCPASRPWYLP